MEKRNRTVWAFVGLIVALAPCGCVVEEQPKGFLPISGRVTYQGQPVKNGTINFLPIREGGVLATGHINNGAITDVITHKPGDGIKEGRYRVTIIAFEEGAVEQRIDRFNGPTHAEVSKLAASTKVLIPLKYSSIHDSDLIVDVSPEKLTFEFNLKDDQPETPDS